MDPPDRLAVPTCVGCGAMNQFGTCDTGCSEHKLELVRAASYDVLLAEAASAHAGVNAFSDVVRAVAQQDDGPAESERAYCAAQRAARDAVRRHPLEQQTIDPEQPTEYATTWWCADCGGIDAPQPCLGICVWRPVEWVRRSLYEQLRERAISERELDQRLRDLLHRIAWITPREGHWEQGWRLVQNEARELLDDPAVAT